MHSDDSGGAGTRFSRRRVLRALGGAGTLATAGCMGSGGSSGGTETATGPATIGLSTPESGRYSPIGTHERNGFELAIDHLNNGGGLIGKERFDNLSGDGVLGRTIESEIIDTGSSASTTDSNVRQRLENDALDMFIGGVAGEVVRTHRDLADEYSTPYFVGSATLDELTGGNCSPHVYRELFNSTTLARSLVPTIASDLGDNTFFFQIHTDTPEGRDFKNSINDVATGDDFGWTPSGNVAVRSGSTDFRSALSQAASNNADVVFLDLLGLDAVNAIQQARDLLREETVVAVPFLTQSVADSLGERVDGIYGTVGWHENLDTPLSTDFSDAYQNAYGGTVGTTSLVPPGPAQNTYGQVLLYASAVETTGSFDPAAVRDTLEGFEYALGAGAERMRACDHQAQRSVPVVQGSADTDSVGNYFELLRGRRDMEPACDEEPAASCTL